MKQSLTFHGICVHSLAYQCHVWTVKCIWSTLAVGLPSRCNVHWKPLCFWYGQPWYFSSHIIRKFWALSEPDMGRMETMYCPLLIRHGSITFLSITIKLQLHFILPITITSNYSQVNYNYKIAKYNYF